MSITASLSFSHCISYFLILTHTVLYHILSDIHSNDTMTYFLVVSNQNYSHLQPQQALQQNLLLVCTLWQIESYSLQLSFASCQKIYDVFDYMIMNHTHRYAAVIINKLQIARQMIFFCFLLRVRVHGTEGGELRLGF